VGGAVSPWKTIFFDFFAIFLEIFVENPRHPSHAWQSLKSKPSARRRDQ
jgi:hypothetical protein